MIILSLYFLVIIIEFNIVSAIFVYFLNYYKALRIFKILTVLSIFS